LKLDLRRWLIVVFGAALPLPFAYPVPGTGAGRVPIDVLFLPVLGIGFLLLGSREWALLRRDRLARLLLAFVVVSSISLPFGVLTFGNFNGIRSYLYQVIILFNFVLGYLALRKLADIDLFVRSFVASLGVVATVLTAFLLWAGVLTNVHSFHNSDALRGAISGWPNGFAVLLAVAFIMCLYVISASQGRTRQIYIGFGVVLALCEVLTFSKTGWVAVAIALWLLYLRYWKIRVQIAIVMVLAIGFIGLFFISNDSFKQQIYTLGTLAIRVQFLGAVATRVNPWTLVVGSGSQSVEALMAGYAHERLPSGMSIADLSSHDEFLNVLIKDGMIALIVLVIAIVVIVVRTRRLSRDSSPAVAGLYRYWYATAWAITITLFAGDFLHYWLVGAMFWAMSGSAVFLVHAHERALVPAERSASGTTAALATDRPHN
jgi:hypothetical protein